MNAENRHAVAVHGETFAELCKEAADLFDAYFGRKIQWSVTSIYSTEGGERVSDGTGQVIAHSAAWDATFEAKVHGVRIGDDEREPAIWFPT